MLFHMPCMTCVVEDLIGRGKLISIGDVITDVYSSGEEGDYDQEHPASVRGEDSDHGLHDEKKEIQSSSSNDDDDGSDISIAQSNSSEDGEEQQQQGNQREFLEGGKLDTFSRAFNRLVEQAQESRMKAPILAGSKSIQKIQEEEKKDLDASKALKQFKDDMKRRGHYIPQRKGTDPEKDAREKRLQKTATKGVVQLFNAINAAQKRIRNEETKGNKGKIARLGKAGFLAEIRNMKEQDAQIQPSEKEDTKNDSGGWEVLKEGFVGINQNSVKMKDWDKEQDSSADDQEAPLSSDEDGF